MVRLVLLIFTRLLGLNIVSWDFSSCLFPDLSQWSVNFELWPCFFFLLSAFLLFTVGQPYHSPKIKNSHHFKNSLFSLLGIHFFSRHVDLSTSNVLVLHSLTTLTSWTFWHYDLRAAVALNHLLRSLYTHTWLTFRPWKVAVCSVCLVSEGLGHQWLFRGRIDVFRIVMRRPCFARPPQTVNG